MRMQKNRILYILLTLIVTGCGFTSGSFKDILEAQEYINERKYEKAVSLYKNILLKNPSKNIEVKVSYQLAEINSLYLNQYKESIKYYKRVIRITDKPYGRLNL